MVALEIVLEAKSWRQLGVPKEKEELRKLQVAVHPDRCKDPRANDAFVNLMALYNGPDYTLRVAEGVSTEDHKIVWTPKKGFEDRLSPARAALTRLHDLDPKFSMFFPTNEGVGLDKLTLSYGEGWWYLSDFPTPLDSRTIVWIAKRLAGALHQSNKLGFAHCNINPSTVLLLPTEHGLKIDGWWGAVTHGKRLVLRPDGLTPPKYLGGAVADDRIDVAQAAAMLLSVGKSDKLIEETLQRHAKTPGTPVKFFEDIDNTARRLYGKPKWHPLEVPKTQMI